MGKHLIALPQSPEAQWGEYVNILPAFRSSLETELAHLPPFKDGDNPEDLASFKTIEAGLNHTELIKLAPNLDVPELANPLRGTVRRAKKSALKLLATTTHWDGIKTPRVSPPGGRAIPLSLIRELLCLLDIRGDVYRTPSEDARRRPARPCPFSARGLYDRLLLAGRRARWVCAVPGGVVLLGGAGGDGRSKKGGDDASPRRSWCITYSELSGLLGPVVVEMRACLESVESFCRSLEVAGWGRQRGRDVHRITDLSELRTCVFKLMGFWPRDVGRDYPGYAFDLPSDLGMLLYPQICLDRDEMVGNLEKIVLGPGWDSLRRLEAIARGR